MNTRVLSTCCKVCTTLTDADYNTEFTCSKCNSIQIAKPRIKFRITVFDCTGELEVTIFGEDAEKVLNKKTPEFYSKYTKDSSFPVEVLRARLMDVVLHLSVKSHIYKEKVFFTVSAVDPLSYNGVPFSVNSAKSKHKLSPSLLTEQTQSDKDGDEEQQNVECYSDSTNVGDVRHKRSLQKKGKAVTDKMNVIVERISEEITDLQDFIEVDDQDSDEGQSIADLFKRTKQHGVKMKASRKKLILSDSEDDCNTLDGKMEQVSKSGKHEKKQPVKTSSRGRVIKAKKLD